MSLSPEDQAIVDEVTSGIDPDSIDDFVDLHRSQLDSLYDQRRTLDRAIAMRERAMVNLLARRKGPPL